MCVCVCRFVLLLASLRFPCRRGCPFVNNPLCHSTRLVPGLTLYRWIIRELVGEDTWTPDWLPPGPNWGDFQDRDQ